MATITIFVTILLGGVLGWLLKQLRVPFLGVVLALYFAGSVAVLNSFPEPGGEAAGDTLVWHTIGWLVLGLLIGFVLDFTTFRLPRLDLSEFERASLTWPKWRGGFGQSAAPNDKQLYYITVMKFGALIAAADNRAEPGEYQCLLNVFQINAATFPEAAEVYQRQLAEPERMVDVLRPFKARYVAGSAICESFLMGMAEVAMVDGAAHRREVSLLRLAGDQLGLSTLDITRILTAAGVLSGKADDARAASASGAPQTERERHLATLRLGAGASPADIKSAYRKLARKFHPDKLLSKGLPKDELKRAADMMVRVNEAYDFLKA